MKTYIHTTVHKSLYQPKWPSVGKGINKLQDIHTLEYYSAIKSNEFVILATSWKNLNGILLNKRVYFQKVTFYLHNILVKTKLQIRSAVDRVRGMRLETESERESSWVTELFCIWTVVVAMHISTCVTSQRTVYTQVNFLVC